MRPRSTTPITDTTYRLRDYQQQVVDRVWELWMSRSAQKILLQLPTGAGKTVVFATIAHRFSQCGAPVLVLAHREELLLQAKEKLESITGDRVGLIKAGYREDRDAAIQVASVASLINRELPPASLVIVDEAHHSTALTYTRIFEQFANAAILGVTATPIRSDDRGFREIYDELVVGPAVAWLIEREYLSAYRLFAAPKTVDTAGVGKMGDDYNPRQLAKAVNTCLVMGDLIDAWKRYARHKKTVVFAVNVEHSQAIAAAYRAEGIPAEHLDGSVKDADRKATLERFRSGKTRVLTNCGLLAEGFDVPSIEAVQCVRPTQSLALWLQIVGRSLRPSPGKRHAIVIDHTENWVIHGLPDRPFPWSLDAVERNGDRWGVMCPSCRSTFRPEVEAQTPASFEWCPQQQEFKSIVRYVCPHCQQPFEMEQWQGAGEPPPPRAIDTRREAEIWEIPTDCNVEILADLYRMVGFQRRVKRHVTLQWLSAKLVRLHPNAGFPELRECARLAGMEHQWAINWARQTVAQRWPERLPPQAVAPAQGTSDTAPPEASQATAIISIATVSSQDIVQAIVDRRQAHANGISGEVVELDIRDHATPMLPAGGLQLPTLNTTRSAAVSASVSSPLLPPVSSPVSSPSPKPETLETTEHRDRQHQGQLGLWHVRVTVAASPIGHRTHIQYRSPDGRHFEEHLAGHHIDRYPQGIAELERQLCPARDPLRKRTRRRRTRRTRATGVPKSSRV